jgi:hypothetical protein
MLVIALLGNARQALLLLGIRLGRLPVLGGAKLM